MWHKKEREHYETKQKGDIYMYLNDYECQTTFWQDFTIAEIFGVAAIKDTYKRAFSEWKSNHIYLTELVMVLNHKLWEHYQNGHQEYAKVYDELWKEVDAYACDNLKGEELAYFFRITD